MIYFDTSYVARLYLEDPGWEKVRALAETDQLVCCIHGRAETVAGFHRKFREGAINRNDLATLLRQFDRECELGAFRWLTLSEAVISRLRRVYAALPAIVSLRAADALHLACASENGLKQVHSNDVRLLASASHFGLAGVNVI
ncbi:MAG TPA: type II toxin-antitoxin system VapC family toxin [Verrucomicrobiae bacterium]|nr:type II toxin-antitoxin system VapC family toxin [Verrucomicrobiae bacterium]